MQNVKVKLSLSDDVEGVIEKLLLMEDVEAILEVAKAKLLKREQKKRCVEVGEENVHWKCESSPDDEPHVLLARKELGEAIEKARNELQSTVDRITSPEFILKTQKDYIASRTSEIAASFEKTHVDAINDALSLNYLDSIEDYASPTACIELAKTTREDESYASLILSDFEDS